MNRPRDATRWLATVLTAVAAGWTPTGRAEEAGQAVRPSPKAAELLSQLGSEDAYTRQLAFLRLEALREPATAAAIAAHLKSRDEDMRAYTVRALAAIQGPAAVPTLVQTFKTDRRPRVRRAALLALEPLRETDPEILPLFLQALRDRKPPVRMTAADIVSRIDDPRAKEAVRVRYKRERDRDVRRVLDEAIKRVNEP